VVSRLDVCPPDYLAPFFGFVTDELAFQPMPRPRQGMLDMPVHDRGRRAQAQTVSSPHDIRRLACRSRRSAFSPTEVTQGAMNVMTLSARDLLEASQALDVVVDVRDAVHGVQHHHVST